MCDSYPYIVALPMVHITLIYKYNLNYLAGIEESYKLIELDVLRGSTHIQMEFILQK